MRVKCKCGKFMFVFRNWVCRNVKMFYCPDCKIYRAAHNEVLIK